MATACSPATNMRRQPHPAGLELAGTVDGEIVRQPMMMGKSAYNGMLREVKQRVEGGR